LTTWRYVEAGVTEILGEPDCLRLRLYGRAWPDQPAEFLREEVVWL
jgi:hypothetical protein